MTHITYHVLAEKHNQYLDTLKEAEETAKQWESKGDKKIKIFKITTEEVLDTDEILLKEEAVRNIN